MRKFLFIFVLFCLLPAVSAQAAYDKPYIGETVKYSAKFEDSFIYLARDHNLGYVEMRAANPHIDPWVPGEGTRIILPKRHILPDAPREGIVINLPEMRLYAFVNGDKAPESYPIGIGREGLSTPSGSTKIVRKTEGPIWRPTKRMREEDPELPEFIDPGKDNPLGTHALYLGWPQYAIHGTNRPFGIGRRISSGCIRLYPESIVKLFEQVPVGAPVAVVNQPIKAAWIDEALYVEAHPELEQAIEMEETGEIAKHSLSQKDMQRIIKVAGKYQDRVDWELVRNIVRERKGYPIKVADKPLFDPKDDAKEAAAAKDAAAQGDQDNMAKEEAASKDSDSGNDELITISDPRTNYNL